MCMTTVSGVTTESARPFLSPVAPTSSPPGHSSDRGDDELVVGLRRGDEASYEVLVRRHGGAMLAVARRVMRNGEDAREAVQDAFLQAFRSIHHFRAEAPLSTWLRRIVVNAALMRLRAAGRRPEVALDELLPQFDDTGAHSEPIQPLPVSMDEALESAEIRAQVRACVDQLPDQYRTVIVLRDLQELTTAEAAIALGISENAVKIRLHRAHQALRTLLVRHMHEQN